MDLAALADFNLVAAQGGFGKASRYSGRPKATLSRRVMDLEDSLGVRLFERGTRSLKLTEAGRALYERTHPLVAEILEAGDLAATGLSTPRGRLRISAPVLFSHTMIGKLAAGFARAYPDVVLEINAEDRNVDLVEENYDVAIRVNPRPNEMLVGRCFARDEMLVVAPASMPVPDGQDGDVFDVPAVVLASGFDSGHWTFTHEGRQITLNPRERLRMSSLIPVRDAVLAGAGVGLLPRSLLTLPCVDEAALNIWGPVPDRPIELWVLHSSRRLSSSKVNAFIDYLSNAFPARKLLAAR
ncbi:putative LysR-family transcriptional regulator [Cupriavidus taiwanensis]|uniref:LysR family transcriptional regulator n=1 Tax=Cupriavidus taiwanensis TaxID=164546 RepID=UPI000E12253C|nr:LysR family transcriptional regulator [Cupriavidus taiwanensis]SPA40378.1 putative LysR-family transcriptional regulator [Cupriavidus taiwanensis]